MLAHYWQFEQNGFNEEKQNKLEAAFSFSPQQSMQVISRCATDFYDKGFACDWWQHLWHQVREVDNQQNANQYQEVDQYLFDTIVHTGTNIVYQLSLAGHYSTALHNWLKPLSVVEPVKQKAEILNPIGKQYVHLSEYQQALPWFKKCLSLQQGIDDKQGEGTTLNNISQIYDAKGDYNTALQFLEQSLKIQQGIGDKQGEGTTLNNISQIHKARGDYNTALQFLEQSLKIQQDIGDNAGLCATLFNMGHIHVQNKEIPEAMSCWLSVYAMAKPIQFAQALENLAPQIGLEDGLEGWERLYQQQLAHAKNAT